MAEADLDRNQPATPHKLQKARDEGRVARSPDVTAAIVFASAMLFMAAQGQRVWHAQFLLDRALLLQIGSGDTSVGAEPWQPIAQMLRATMAMAAPFFATLLLAAVAGNLLQTGPVLSMHPVRPDWQRLDPVAGPRRVFSTRTLFLALRTGLKLLLLGAVAWMSAKAWLPQFHRLSALSPLGLLQTLLDDLSSLGLKLAAMLGAIAMLDAIHNRRDFAKRMRMSRREIKDETKNRDGDPRIRARLRGLRREMLKRSLAVRKTRGADVLITNPTHVAVALRYTHGEMSAPQLVAKGQGLMAAAMRGIAARHRIPVVQNPSLARALYRELALDQAVPATRYAQVARIIVWVFAQRANAAPEGRRWNR